MRALVAQLTDTHIVTRGSTYFGVDTARYLSDAIDELHALPVLPDCVVVTGDLVNTGKHAEYDRFFGVMQRLRVPYFVVPGNHDDGVALRAALPSRSFGASREPRLRYAIEEFAIRIVGLDVNKPGSSPGAALDDESLSWLERILEGKRKPTILCVHQPPFRSGLHYLDSSVSAAPAAYDGSWTVIRKSGACSAVTSIAFKSARGAMPSRAAHRAPPRKSCR